MANEMYFYNDRHEQFFMAMLQKYPQALKDREYRVACYVIAHPEIYPKAFGRGQAWENIFDDWMDKEDFSSSIRALVDLGLHLYGGGSHPFKLMDALASWDTGNYQVFLQAIEIRKGWA